MYGVKSHVCSAFANSVRQTFFFFFFFTLAIKLVAKQQQYLDNCMGTLWLKGGEQRGSGFYSELFFLSSPFFVVS